MIIKVNLLSLGCPKNLVDSENMLGLLEENGYQIVAEPDEAEIIIVNTCGFIESAKEESINEVLAMAEYKEKGVCKGLILAGCLGERYAQELLAELPEVDAITGAHAWEQIASVVGRVLNKERFIYTPGQPEQKELLARKLSSKSVTAYLKISEGCDNACSYCAIPKIRGPYVSKPIEIVVAEAQQLAQQGIKELILVAQDVTRYGEDFSGKLLLPELLERICTVEGIKWIRILYAYPQYITDELITVMAKEEKICKYIDIPLQHASDSVLERMNRRDKKSGIINLLNELRSKISGICIRTTFIVGFPEETQREFEELKEFMLAQRFDRVGIFTYSQEDGTVAADMPQVDQEIKEERYHELMAIQAKISEEINIELEGTELEILVEDITKQDVQLVVSGRSYREAPEIDGVIYLENADNAQTNTFVRAKIEQGFTYDLLAQVIEEN